MMPWATKGKGKDFKGRSWGGYKGKGLPPSHIKPQNTDELQWYLCPYCYIGKWCIGNNPPTHCRKCWNPCEFSLVLPAKGNGKATRKGGEEAIVNGPTDVNKGKGKGKGKGKEDNGKNNDAGVSPQVQSRKVWNKGNNNFDESTTVNLLNQLMAKGENKLAQDLSQSTGFPIPQSKKEDKGNAEDVYNQLQTALSQKKRMEKEKNEQITKLLRITSELTECEDKVNEYTQSLDNIEKDIQQLKSKHLTEVAGGAFKRVTKTKLDLIDQCMISAVNQMGDIATNAVPTDADQPIKDWAQHFTTAVKGAFDNAMYNFRFILNDDNDIIEDQLDILNNTNAEGLPDVDITVNDDVFVSTQDAAQDAAAATAVAQGSGDACGSKRVPEASAEEALAQSAAVKQRISAIAPMDDVKSQAAGSSVPS